MREAILVVLEARSVLREAKKERKHRGLKTVLEITRKKKKKDTGTMMIHTKTGY